MLFHVSLDDTDSLEGGCTTYLTTLIVKELLSRNVSFEDYPIQFRCNPNIPFKTRGNAAQALHFNANKESIKDLKESIKRIVSENSLSEDTAVLFLEGKIPEILKEFSNKALTEMVPLAEAKRLARKAGIEVFSLKKNTGKGLVGALAAMGEPLENDYTFELIAYRSPEKKDKKRLIDKDSVRKLDEKYFPEAFDNYFEGKVKVCPRGKDPVYCAVRANKAETALKAFKMIKPLEEVLFYTVFRSNQKTEPHFPLKRISQARKYDSLSFKGKVKETPRYYGSIRSKKHVIFKLSDNTRTINCVAYERTRGFRKTVSMLEQGDEVLLAGGIRPAEHGFPKALNIEKLIPLRLAEKTCARNPSCPECGKRMASQGKGKGFKCGCGYKSAKMVKEIIGEKRGLEENKLYLPHTDAQRHLIKPFERYGRENKGFEKPNNLNKMIFNSYKGRQ